ncbi:TetR/AcrR family transcriptional regulator [Paractinoplanes durhamensis]|uniref:Tetracyclin repressor-like C-terminal group 31 domain-containing protein n=1 Tax=Paractinoplanes durhamensis TaxID=113563 RepID=A0ABQ3ZDE7_9ACTN|nr:TetR/AcrR family transcriptional regulator [Actinoplanes durhamensis]GIE07862.1 hypothetical protein Adu01nite_92120 [Actinoplanes durhamensis]
MAGRREVVLDAGIEVVGLQGIRALTHRAVDAVAGLPAGSTSNLFRTSGALLDAIVVRFAERERANAEAMFAGATPRTAGDLAGVLVAFAHDATGPNRALTLARYAILVEAGIRPALRDQLGATGANVNAWFRAWLLLAGSADPERDGPIIMNHWTGIVLHELARPAPKFDPASQIHTLLTSLIGR